MTGLRSKSLALRGSALLQITCRIGHGTLACRRDRGGNAGRTDGGRDRRCHARDGRLDLRLRQALLIDDLVHRARRRGGGRRHDRRACGRRAVEGCDAAGWLWLWRGCEALTLRPARAAIGDDRTSGNASGQSRRDRHIGIDAGATLIDGRGDDIGRRRPPGRRGRSSGQRQEIS